MQLYAALVFSCSIALSYCLVPAPTEKCQEVSSEIKYEDVFLFVQFTFSLIGNTIECYRFTAEGTDFFLETLGRLRSLRTN